MWEKNLLTEPLLCRSTLLGPLLEIPCANFAKGPADIAHRYPGNLNMSFAYVEGESLIMGLKVRAVMCWGLGFGTWTVCVGAALQPVRLMRDGFELQNSCCT